MSNQDVVCIVSCCIDVEENTFRNMCRQCRSISYDVKEMLQIHLMAFATICFEVVSFQVKYTKPSDTRMTQVYLRHYIYLKFY